MHPFKVKTVLSSIIDEAWASKRLKVLGDRSSFSIARIWSYSLKNLILNPFANVREAEMSQVIW